MSFHHFLIDQEAPRRPDAAPASRAANPVGGPSLTLLLAPPGPREMALGFCFTFNRSHFIINSGGFFFFFPPPFLSLHMLADSSPGITDG